MTKDVRNLKWAADELGIGVSTAYRLAPQGDIPGAFKVGAQWRVSVPAFLREVHGIKPVDLTLIDATSDRDSQQDLRHVAV
jgi:hypothetical protein